MPWTNTDDAIVEKNLRVVAGTVACAYLPEGGCAEGWDGEEH